MVRNGEAGDRRSIRRYITLDAIRGLAAIVVAVGHVSPWFGVSPRFWLAVDLFFLMSGFVLADVYARRLDEGLTVMRFMGQRYLRLYPLFLVGLSLSVLFVAVSGLSGHSYLSVSSFACALVTGLLLLPSPLGDPEDALVPLNTPGWSLFFELAANLLFAVLWPRLRGPLLPALVAASGAGLVAAYFHGESFGGMHLHDFWWGFPRVGFSFFLGVLVQRIVPRRRIESDLAWLLVPVLALAFLHHLPGGDLLDLLTVTLLFPAILVCAVQVEPRQARICAVAGAISYPLYAIHNPLELGLERVFHALRFREAAFAPWPGLLFLAAGLPLAYLLDRHYDAPVRRIITRSLSRRSRRLTEAATPL